MYFLNMTIVIVIFVLKINNIPEQSKNENT